MMGPRRVDQAALFYQFSLERHVPATHLLRSIDRFVDLSDVRSHLAPFYSSTGRPSIDPELLVHVLNARVNRYGWTFEQALGVVPRPGYEAGVAGVVYLIEHAADEKKYVGVTMGAVEERWDQHIQKAMDGARHHHAGLHNAIKQYGAENFRVSVIATAKNHSELQSLEIEFIQRLSTRAPAGFNLNAGGSGTRTAGKAIIVQGRRYESYMDACRAPNTMASGERSHLLGLEPRTGVRLARERERKKTSTQTSRNRRKTVSQPQPSGDSLRHQHQAVRRAT
jgi:GIY-YIG catalytic domain